MKTLLFLFFVSLSMAVAAQMVLTDGQGQYTVLSGKNWKDTGIIAEEGSEAYLGKFAEALANPNFFIVGEKTDETIKLKLFFKKIVEHQVRGISYNPAERTISFVEKSGQSQEETSYLPLVFLLPIFLMTLSNIVPCFRKNKLDSVTILSAFVVATIATIIFAGDTAAVVVVFVLTAFIAAAATAFVDKEKKIYEGLVAIFYILMVVGNVMLYI